MDLASTRYTLANPGVEYLVLQPEPGEAFTVTLEPGTYAMEWFGVDDRTTVEGGRVSSAEGEPLRFQPPFDGGPSVLYLSTAIG